MKRDEEHSDHSVELAPRGTRATHPQTAAARRSAATIGVTFCLALAGIVVAVAIVRSSEPNDEKLVRESETPSELDQALAAAEPPPVNVPPPAPSPARGQAPQVVIVNAPASPAAAPAAPEPAPRIESNSVPPVAAPSPSVAPPSPLQSQQNAALAATGQSIPCGPNTCNAGDVCCNPSCGVCTAPGASCNTTQCDNPITYPTSQMCGMATCNDGSVCCNPSCGICTAPGASCPQSC